MAARRIKNDQAREHERRAWELRQQGQTQEQIAAELGVTHQSVSRILRRVSERTVRQLAEDVLLHKLVQNARLDHIIDEAMQAWERSKLPAVRAVRKTHDSGAEVLVVTTTSQCGDVDYLTLVREALADQSRLWGLDALTQHVVTTGPIEITQVLSDEQRAECAEQVLRIVRDEDDDLPGDVRSAV